MKQAGVFVEPKETMDSTRQKRVKDSIIALIDSSDDISSTDSASRVTNFNVGSNDFSTDNIKPKSLTSNILDILMHPSNDCSLKTENQNCATNLQPSHIDETQLFDEFQCSTSELESSDSEIFLSSVTDLPRHRTFQTNTAPTLATPDGRDITTVHKISDAGKRMIKQHLPRVAHYSQQMSESYVPDATEFPPLSAGIDPPHTNNTATDEVPPYKHFDHVTRFDPMSGVRQILPKPTTGRGQTLKLLADLSKKSPWYLDEGKRQVYEFPSDDELLLTPQIAEMIENVHIAGETKHVTKQFYSADRF